MKRETITERFVRKDNTGMDVWEEIAFHDLKPGDKFRLYDHDWHRVTDEEGNFIFTAAGYPYFDDPTPETIDIASADKTV